MELLSLDFSLNEYAIALSSWSTAGAGYGFFTAILVLILGRLHYSMDSTIEQLKTRTFELQHAKEQMEKEIDEKRRRAKELEELLERLNSIVSLKEEQVSAIRSEIDSILKRNAWRNRIWTMLMGAVWFVLGLIVRGLLGF